MDNHGISWQERVQLLQVSPRGVPQFGLHQLVARRFHLLFAWHTGREKSLQRRFKMLQTCHTSWRFLTWSWLVVCRREVDMTNQGEPSTFFNLEDKLTSRYFSNPQSTHRNTMKYIEITVQKLWQNMAAMTESEVLTSDLEFQAGERRDVQEVVRAQLDTIVREPQPRSSVFSKRWTVHGLCCCEILWLVVTRSCSLGCWRMLQNARSWGQDYFRSTARCSIAIAGAKMCQEMERSRFPHWMKSELGLSHANMSPGFIKPKSTVYIPSRLKRKKQGLFFCLMVDGCLYINIIYNTLYIYNVISKAPLNRTVQWNGETLLRGHFVERCVKSAFVRGGQKWTRQYKT